MLIWNQGRVHNINLELLKTNIRPFKILKYESDKYALKKQSALNVKNMEGR